MVYEGEQRLEGTCTVYGGSGICGYQTVNDRLSTIGVCYRIMPLNVKTWRIAGRGKDISRTRKGAAWRIDRSGAAARWEGRRYFRFQLSRGKIVSFPHRNRSSYSESKRDLLPTIQPMLFFEHPVGVPD